MYPTSLAPAKAKLILLLSRYIVAGVALTLFNAFSIEEDLVERMPEPVVVVAVVPESLPIESRAEEARLIIHAINVDAAIKDTGVTSAGAMAVPGNAVDVGWYSLGTRPGEQGSAVIGGHNEWNNTAGAFADLHQLQKGDVVTVVDAEGVSATFIVRDMRTYEASDTKTGIFGSTGGAHLNLITCSGVWDPGTKSYTQRLVIFTDLATG